MFRMPKTRARYEWVAPPGWPPAPKGWSPDPEWQPDPSWPDAPAGWRWWRPAMSGRAQRVGELGTWIGLVFALCLAGGLYLHDTGVDGPGVVPAMLATLGGLAGVSVVVGVRQQGTAWWTGLVYSVAFAWVAGWVLVALIGPDSGAPGACSPGEMCDMDQGVGFVTGPMFLWLPLLCLMLAARGCASLVHVSAAARGGRRRDA